MAASDSVMSMPSKPSKLPRLSIALPRLRPHALPWLASLGLHASFAGALAYVGVTPSESPTPSEPVAVVLMAGGGGGGGGSPEKENVAEVEAIAPPAPPPPVKRAPPRRPAPRVETAAATIPAIPEVVEEVVEEPVVDESVDEDVVDKTAEYAELDDEDTEVDVEESATATAVASNGNHDEAVQNAGSGGDAAGPGTGLGAPGWVGDGVAGGSPFGFAHGDAIDVAHAATAPRVLRQTPPDYPRRARSAGIEGLVVVRAIVDRNGRVEPEFLRVLRSVPALDEAALEAVRSWRFSPARDDQGRPIRVIVKIPVRFALK